MYSRQELLRLSIIPLVVLASLGAAWAVSAEDPSPREDERLAGFRKGDHYEMIYRDGTSFLALPAEKQDAMRRLHQDLEKVAPAERERLQNALARYADWLDRLPSDERQAVIDAPNKVIRLKRIKSIRESEWMARQPVALRRLWEKIPALLASSLTALLPDTPGFSSPLLAVSSSSLFANGSEVQDEFIRRARRDEMMRSRDWTIAHRFWPELTDPGKRHSMPVRAADFGKEVDVFVKEYLRPWLSPEDRERLDRAEGHWPQYPMTLVELADRHPMALPQRYGPNAFRDLPTEVQSRVTRVFFDGKEPKKKNQPDTYFHNLKAGMKGVDARLDQMKLRNPAASVKFATAIAAYAESKNVRMPYELWAARPKTMSRPMEIFLDEKGPFKQHLISAEREQLSAVEGKWPEYPSLVRDLARRYGFRPPWQTLPDIGDKRDEMWEKYRVKGFEAAE